MNDNELVTLVRESVADVHVLTPVSQIISRGRAVRTRSRIAGSAGLAVTSVALAGALAAGLTGVIGAAPAGGRGVPRDTRGTRTVQNPGFTLTANKDGTLTLTMSQMFNPVALQQALRRDGIRAMVRTGSYCTSGPTAPDPFSIGVLSTRPPIAPRVGLVRASGAAKNGPPSLPRTETVINPAAMPAGTELFFGYVPGDHLLSAALIYPGSYTCGSQPPVPEPKTP